MICKLVGLTYDGREVVDHVDTAEGLIGYVGNRAAKMIREHGCKSVTVTRPNGTVRDRFQDFAGEGRATHAATFGSTP